jgi:hypothetical protein
MASSDEMYEQGALDAERDELNTFYYQHYYYYRKGYDGTRRRLRRSGTHGVESRPHPGYLVALVVLLLGLGGAAYTFREQLLPRASPTPASLNEPTARPTTRPTTRPTITLPPATPTTPPTPVLAVGGRARVANLNGAPLRARAGPGVNQPIAARIPEGSEVVLLEGPVEADGYTWWRIEAEAGTGWSAQGDAEGTVAFLEPLP